MSFCEENKDFLQDSGPWQSFTRAKLIAPAKTLCELAGFTEDFVLPSVVVTFVDLELVPGTLDVSYERLSYTHIWSF